MKTRLGAEADMGLLCIGKLYVCCVDSEDTVQHGKDTALYAALISGDLLFAEHRGIAVRGLDFRVLRSIAPNHEDICWNMQ